MTANAQIIPVGTQPPLSVMERGGSGIPIVFLHGNGFCKEVFNFQFESNRLSQNRLLAIDLPGHGASPDFDDPFAVYNYAGMAKHVIKTLSTLEVEACIVVGWSLGGQVAYEMLDDPCIAGIFTIGAPPAQNGPMGLIKAFHFNRMLLLAGKAKYTFDDALHFERSAIGSRADGSFVNSILRVDPAFRPALSRSILRRQGISQCDLVDSSTKPIAIVHGQNDSFIRESFITSIRGAAIWRGKAISVSNFGHAPFIERPNNFNKMLSEFAIEVATASSTHQISPQKLAANG